MDNGFDYPNDLCIQNALWRRLKAIEILQIRLEIRSLTDIMITARRVLPEDLGQLVSVGSSFASQQ